LILQDLYEDVDYGVLSSNTKIKVKVNPSGCVILKMETIPERFSKRPLNPYYYRHNQN
jgi:alpha-N-acetylgalactosaminidase